MDLRSTLPARRTGCLPQSPADVPPLAYSHIWSTMRVAPTFLGAPRFRGLAALIRSVLVRSSIFWRVTREVSFSVYMTSRALNPLPNQLASSQSPHLSYPRRTRVLWHLFLWDSQHCC